jgi:hypothetical protein
MAVAPPLLRLDPRIATAQRRLQLLEDRLLDRLPDLPVNQLTQRGLVTLNSPQLPGTLAHGAFLPPP